MSFFIDALDRGLARGGSTTVTLRRSTGTTNISNVDVDCLAKVRSPKAEELRAGITQQQTMVILSLTEINTAQWPGGQNPGGTRDARIPSKEKGDKVKIDGRWCAVEHCNPIWLGGVLVRLNTVVIG